MMYSRLAALPLLALALFAAAGGLRGQQPAPADVVAKLPGHTDTVEAVALSPDGHYLAAGGFGSVVVLWDIRSRKLVHELDQGGSGAFALEFSPDGSTLAVSGFEPVASLWDVATGTQIGPKLTAGSRRTMLAYHAGTCSSPVAPTGRRSGGWTGSASIR